MRRFVPFSRSRVSCFMTASVQPIFLGERDFLMVVAGCLGTFGLFGQRGLRSFFCCRVSGSFLLGQAFGFFGLGGF